MTKIKDFVKMFGVYMGICFVTFLLGFVFFRHVLLKLVPSLSNHSYVYEKVMGNDMLANVLELLLYFIFLLSYILLVKKKTKGNNNSINNSQVRLITIVFAIMLCGYSIWSFGIPVFDNVPLVTKMEERIEQNNENCRKLISEISSGTYQYSSSKDKEDAISSAKNGIIDANQAEEMIASCTHMLLCQITYFIVSVLISVFFLIFLRKVLKTI